MPCGIECCLTVITMAAPKHLLLFLWCGGALGCPFHCNTSLCGDQVLTTSRITYLGPLCHDILANCTNDSGGNSTPHEYGTIRGFDLQNRNITSIQPGGMSCWASSFQVGVGVFLDNNPLGPNLPNGTSTGLSEATFVTLRNCSITTVRVGEFEHYQNAQLQSLIVDLASNLITELPMGLMSSVNVHKTWLSFENNRIVDVEYPFDQLGSLTSTTIILANNSICDVYPALQYSTEAPLFLDVSGNDISALGPAFPWNSEAPTSSLIFRAWNNPLLNVSGNLFLNGAVFYGDITIDISNSTAGNVAFPSDFQFVSNFRAASILTFSARGTGANTTLVSAFQNYQLRCGLGCEMVLDLSLNNITALESGSLQNVNITSLTLSQNGLSTISADALKYTLALKTLDLSQNHLSFVPRFFIDNAPLLETFKASDNQIVALPASNNRIFKSFYFVGNPLACSSYGPLVSGCTCPTHFVTIEFCGFVRCVPNNEPQGCPEGQILNSSNCEMAPWSDCVNLESVLGEQYYNTNIDAFEHATQCRTAFPDRVHGGFLEAFQFANVTSTSDRLCSICSVCPTGFIRTPCSSTVDSKCTRDNRISPVEIAVVVLAVVVVLLIGGLTSAYLYVGKARQAHELGETQGYLELTERLLGTEREEKERMGQAWSIDEKDLTFGGVIGVGASGRVFKGSWGHIPVAIKVLLRPMDELDPFLAEEFDREVSLMRSIRHPNLLTFYGAGIRSEGGFPYLVTELMVKGSLKTLLRSKATTLSWQVRLQFAADAAGGLRYLHSVGYVHRDVKADNCFVDGNLRVKVADFGTGRITAKLRQQHQDRLPSPAANDAFLDREKTLSKGTGSPLWMAPELLSGQAIKEGKAAALDIFSFAVLLFEIWARVQPWNELKEQGIQFSQRLQQEVIAGVRPALPLHCETAPPGYYELMNDCWNGDSSARPTSTVVAVRIRQIQDAWSVNESSM